MVIFALLMHFPKCRWYDIFCVLKVFYKIRGFIKSQSKANLFDAEVGVCQQSFGLQYGSALDHFFGCFANGFHGAFCQFFLCEMQFFGIKGHLFALMIMDFKDVFKLN